MRVAFNVEQLLYHAPGGTARYASRIAALLGSEAGVEEVLPFTAWHGRRAVARALDRFGLSGGAAIAPVRRLPLPRPLLYEAWNATGSPALDRLPRVLRGADLVHSPSVVTPPCHRVPVVVNVHDAAFALFPETYPARGLRFHRRSVEMTARRADLVITGTQSAAEEIVANTPIPSDRLRVVPDGVDHRPATVDEVKATLARHQLNGLPYVLWVGSLEPRKNVSTLVEAFALLHRRGDVPHQLVLVGPRGWLDRHLLPEEAKETLGAHLRVLGEVDDTELRALYAGSELFALPSLHEGFGLPVLEAMVQGTPVICSDIAVLREVAGGAARFVPPMEAGAWADAIARLVVDRDECRLLVEAGHRRAAEFGWDRTARLTRAVYDEALAS
ncbi:MAG TPA: glycosyltransferase family 1 protein [Acidimicrobiales bacterium]|nr:glycosyltransferase family 1 protein [Acidimicrobiales bacterium]